MVSRALAYIGGGLLSGVGKGMVEDGVAMREAAREELRFQRERQMAGEDREFRRGEREAGQEFQSGEAQAGRDFTASQNTINRGHQTGEREATQEFQASQADKTRSFQQRQAEADQKFRADEADKTRRHSAGLLSNTQEIQDSEGYYWQRGADGKAVPVTDAQGKHIKGPLTKSGTGSAPADVQTAEWLVTNKVAGNLDEAWQMVRAAREKPETRANLVIRVYESMKRAQMTPNGDDAAMRADAEAFVDDLIAKDRKAEGGSKGKGGDDTNPRPAAPAGQDGKDAAGKVPGSGTQQDPYKASTQEHIDWFKANAPAGAVLDVNGKLYKK